MKQKPGPKPKEKPYAYTFLKYYDIVNEGKVRFDIAVNHGNGATIKDIARAARKAILDFAKQHENER